MSLNRYLSRALGKPSAEAFRDHVPDTCITNDDNVTLRGMEYSDTLFQTLRYVQIASDYSLASAAAGGELVETTGDLKDEGDRRSDVGGNHLLRPLPHLVMRPTILIWIVARTRIRRANSLSRTRRQAYRSCSMRSARRTSVLQKQGILVSLSYG